MNVNLGIWDKLTKLVVFLLFVAGLIGVFYWYLPLVQQNQRYRKEIIALDGRIALVTGAGRGIGFATAKMLADAGATVWLNARTAGSLEQTCAAIAAWLGSAR